MSSARRVVVIGIDPTAVAHLGIDSELVTEAIARGQTRFAEVGIDSDLCLVGLDQAAAAQQIVDQLTAHEYGCVVIGGGIRKPPQMLEFFEVVINLVRLHAPESAIALNTNAENSVEAAQRWMAALPG